MALIECSRCGKKYSDALKECFHCGYKEGLNAEQSSADTTSISRLTNPLDSNVGEDKEKLVDLVDFPIDMILELEMEFINKSSWSLKHQQKLRANDLMKRSCSLFMLVSLSLFIILFLFAHHINNLNYIPYFWIFNTSIFIIGLVGWFVFLIRGFVLSKSSDSVKYNEHYKKWLKEEKKINLITEDENYVSI